MKSHLIQHKIENARSASRPIRRRNSWSPEKQAAELSRLNLNADDFAFFQTFVQQRWDYIRRPCHIVSRALGALAQSDHWSLIRRRLTDAALVQHLSGECWLGVGAGWSTELHRHVTQHFVADLDRGAQESTFSLHRRYRDLVNVLGEPTFVLQSSASGGLHVYYCFDRVAELWDCVRHKSGQSGAVIRLLESAGLCEANGRLEVYPRGKYRVSGPQARLRLPFGLDSLLLDPISLAPICRSGIESLRMVKTQIATSSAYLLNPGELVARALTLGPDLQLPSRKRTRRSPWRNDNYSDQRASTEELWRYGLSRDKQFNEAVTALAFDCNRAGDTCEEAIARIQAWSDEHHNGYSRTCQNPARARREVSSVARRVFAWRGGARDFGSVPGLSTLEVARIATLLQDDIVDPKTGEVLDPALMASFLFQVTQRAKQWLIAEVRRVAMLAAGGNADESRQVVGKLRIPERYCPQPSSSICVVPIPSALRRRFRGLGKDAHFALWRGAVQAGFVTQTRVASAAVHRAATWAIWLDLNSIFDESDAHRSVDEALRSLFAHNGTSPKV